MQTPGDRRHEGRGRDLDGGRNLDGGRREGRGRGQSGAALIEFALVVPLLVAILYAIVSFGVALAVKQSITQAASDAARAAVPAPQNGDKTEAGAVAAATGQATNTLGWILGSGQTCNNNTVGITCTTSVATCPKDVAQNNCITVTVTDDYKNHPIIPNLPLLGFLLPSTISSSTTSLLAGSNPPTITG
ncbi:MAG: TadE/TadG family type IV pilus assembly protein [Acidimicrobiales bacterium]